MLVHDFALVSLFSLLVILTTPPLGRYLAFLFTDNSTGKLEGFFYRFSGINPKEEMNWKRYFWALFSFNSGGFLFLFLLLLFQYKLPLNPEAVPGMPWDLALNTAISFITNTNWQAYAGENSLSYLSQMAGLTVQNFLSAATGLAVMMALIRGILRTNAETVGNFWQDLVRGVIYLLLPLSTLMALLLVTQGVPQTLASYVEVTTLENGHQTIPLGPVASQVAIKQLGTNGGGFFSANSAHPFENPSPLTNLLQSFAILLIPAASVYAYGVIMKAKRHGWLLFGVMSFLWLAGLFISFYAQQLSPAIAGATPLLEGQEIRFGPLNSLLWSMSTTGTSNGSINTMLSSLSPLAGGVALFNMMLGEVIFGGIGVGLCSVIMFALLTVFLSGLMVGRTPEYFGKKIEKREMQWVVLAILAPGALILVGAALFSMFDDTVASLSSTAPHGLSELLYAFTSAAANNGSAFAGIQANTLYYNVGLSIVMLLGRLAILLPSLAIAGSLATKKRSPPSLGTFSTESLLFAFLLLGILCIVGGLTFFPVLALGPIAEQLLFFTGVSL